MGSITIKNKVNIRSLISLALQITGLFTWIVVASVLGTIVTENQTNTSTPIPIITPTPINLDHDFVMLEVNNYRLSKGLKPFEYDKRTCEMAKTRIKEIVVNFSHDGFDLERFCPSKMCDLGEVLARGAATEKETVQGWINSPTHNYILVGNYKTGCAATEGSYAVVVMATWR